MSPKPAMGRTASGGGDDGEASSSSSSLSSSAVAFLPTNYSAVDGGRNLQGATAAGDKGNIGRRADGGGGSVEDDNDDVHDDSDGRGHGHGHGYGYGGAMTTESFDNGDASMSASVSVSALTTASASMSMSMSMSISAAGAGEGGKGKGEGVGVELNGVQGGLTARLSGLAGASNDRSGGGGDVLVVRGGTRGPSSRSSTKLTTNAGGGDNGNDYGDLEQSGRGAAGGGDGNDENGANAASGGSRSGIRGRSNVPRRDCSRNWCCRSLYELNRIRILCGRVVNNDRVQLGIIALIAVNAIMMGLATFDFVSDNAGVSAKFEYIDDVILITFTTELGLQFLYQGLRLFLDGWLLFDFVVIFMSWAFTDMQIIRAFRIFRALRLVTRVRILRNLVTALFSVMPNMTNIGMLLFLIMYIFCVMVTQLFGHMYHDGSLALDYFGTLDRSFFTLFQMMAFDSWADVTREVMVTYAWAWAVFLPYVILTGIVMVNLIVAVICEAIAALHDDQKANLYGRAMEESSFEDEKDDDDEEDEEEAVEGGASPSVPLALSPSPLLRSKNAEFQKATAPTDRGGGAAADAASASAAAAAASSPSSSSSSSWLPPLNDKSGRNRPARSRSSLDVDRLKAESCLSTAAAAANGGNINEKNRRVSNGSFSRQSRASNLRGETLRRRLAKMELQIKRSAEIQKHAALTVEYLLLHMQKIPTPVR